MNYDELQKNVIGWAEDKGILDKSDPLKQLEKTLEEYMETVIATVRHQNDFWDDGTEIKDGIGDMFVTLIIFAKMHGWTTEECLEHAWNEIKDRTGKMENGLFVKD